MPRLDLECANIARKLGATFVKKDEKIISDAAAVLAGQGLYAFAVYLRSLKNVKAEPLLKSCGELIRFLGPPNSPQDTKEQIVDLIQNIAADLQKLLLAKKLVAETLTYLKYEVKNKQDESSKKEATA